MAGDDNWPDDMPPVEKSLGIDDEEGLDDDVKEDIAGAIEEDYQAEHSEKENDNSITKVIGGEHHVFFQSGGCERCGSDAAGILWRDPVDPNGVTGGAFMLCELCKEEVMEKHEEEGYNWETFGGE